MAITAAEDARQWLTEEAGFAGLDQLGPEYRELLARTFRRDSTAANRQLLEAIESGRAPLDAPCTLVVATDDPVTEGYATAYRRWEALVAGLRLVPIDGGHYFTRTRPARVADLVARRTAARRRSGRHDRRRTGGRRAGRRDGGPVGARDLRAGAAVRPLGRAARGAGPRVPGARGAPGFFSVTRYDDARTVLRDAVTFSSEWGMASTAPSACATRRPVT